MITACVLRNDLMGIIVNVAKVRFLVFPKFDGDGFTQVTVYISRTYRMNEKCKGNISGNYMIYIYLYIHISVLYR